MTRRIISGFLFSFLTIALISCGKAKVVTTTTAPQTALPQGTYLVTAVDNGEAPNELVDSDPYAYFRFTGSKIEFGFKKKGWQSNGELSANGNEIFAKVEFTGYMDVTGADGKFQVTAQSQDILLLKGTTADGKKQAIQLKKITGAELEKAEADIKP